MNRLLLVLLSLSLLAGCEKKEKPLTPPAPISLAEAPSVIAARSLAYEKSLQIIPAAEFLPSPSIDRNGKIDVWQLRSDVSQLEHWIASDDTDQCHPGEGDEESDEENQRPLSAADIQRQQSEQLKAEAQAKACETAVHEHYAIYKRMYDAFNAAWLPVLLRAAKKGDNVAEVILLRCDTTPVIDRSSIDSTCSDIPGRARAQKRLREIGFQPAIDLESEPGYCEFQSCGSRSPQGIAHLQELVLNAFKHGNFGSIPSDATSSQFVFGGTSLQFQLWRNAMLIEAAKQDVMRVFRFRTRKYEYEGDDQSTLRLLRNPSTPGSLTWGPDLFEANGTLYREDHWRSSSKYCKLYGNEIEKDLRMLLKETEANVARYLSQDNRWGIFLMQRVGHHEWVPAGAERVSQKNGEIDPSWLGHWELVQSNADFGDPHVLDDAGGAEITQQDDVTSITIHTNSQKVFAPGLGDVSNCKLRYSGGSTLTSENGSISQTALGDLRELIHSQAGTEWINRMKNSVGEINGLEPLEHTKAYQQVLMQCPGAEMPDNDVIRFLLLAGDTLIEIKSKAPFCESTYIYHYRRKLKDNESK